MARFIERLKNKARKLLPPNEQQSGDDLVTIATFQPVMQPHAGLLRARLEAAGIPCIITGQWHTRADFVRLQVQQSHAAEARAILAKFESG